MLLMLEQLMLGSSAMVADIHNHANESCPQDHKATTVVEWSSTGLSITSLLSKTLKSAELCLSKPLS